MSTYKYIYGPVPSRRMGSSLGISPIPEKMCNYSCIYCQLGRTNKMSNRRDEFFPLKEILDEVKQYKLDNINFDVITIVGEGEPTLYSRLKDLIKGIQSIFNKPVAVITNGALICDPNVRNELMSADIVLPSLDAYNEDMFKKINRPSRDLHFDDIIHGLIDFSNEYQGQLMLEIMLIADMNSEKEDIDNFHALLNKIKYDRIYINTVVRPPAESGVKSVNRETILYAVEKLNGISVDELADGSFYSDITDHYESVLSICSRHPMSTFELNEFLKSRNMDEPQIANLYDKLSKDERVDVIDYKGYVTYRALKDF